MNGMKTQNRTKYLKKYEPLNDDLPFDLDKFNEDYRSKQLMSVNNKINKEIDKRKNIYENCYNKLVDDFMIAIEKDENICTLISNERSEIYKQNVDGMKDFIEDMAISNFCYEINIKGYHHTIEKKFSEGSMHSKSFKEIIIKLK